MNEKCFVKCCGEMNWRNDPHTLLDNQTQWLPHICTWKISGVFNGIQTHDLCDASAVLSLTELLIHSDVIKVNLLDSHIPVKGMMSEWKMFCEVWLKDELKKWFSHLLYNLSDCLTIMCISNKFQVQCSNTNWAMKPLRIEHVNLLGSSVSVRGMMSGISFTYHCFRRNR